MMLIKYSFELHNQRSSEGCVGVFCCGGGVVKGELSVITCIWIGGHS